MMKKIFIIAGIGLLSLGACKQSMVKSLEAAESLAKAGTGALLLALPDYATVTIKNVKSGKFLEVGGNPALNEKFKDNALLQQWQTSLSGTEMDRWQKNEMSHRGRAFQKMVAAAFA